LPWFWNICLLISVMSLLSSGFLSTQLLFILCPMSQFLEQEWTSLFISSWILNNQYLMVFLFSTLRAGSGPGQEVRRPGAQAL
jgi:hypothetical protein